MEKLKEIINRKNQTFTVEEQVHVIEEYIKIRKGINVIVNPIRDLGRYPPEIRNNIAMNEFSKVQSAFQDAQKWLINNKDEYDKD